MIVNPVFTNSKERQDIVSTNNLSYRQEIPNSEKNYVSQAQTALTEAGANFVASNLNTYNVGEIEVVGKRRFVFSGQTIKPYSDSTNASQDNVGTDPFIWNYAQSSVDAFCINKSIQEMKLNIAGKQFTSVDRENPEMIDIFASQFNCDDLKSRGIYGRHGYKTGDQVAHAQNKVHGSMLLADQDWGALGTSAVLKAPVFPVNRKTRDLHDNALFARNTQGYCRVTDVKFKYGTTLSAATDLLTSYTIPGWEGFAVPVVNVTDVVPWYSYTGSGTAIVIDNTKTLWQEVELEIHEFIIDPNLSNPYSRNQNKKIYYNGSNTMNVEFKFNQEYLTNSFLIWQPSYRNQLGQYYNPTTTLPAKNKLVSSNWVADMTINFWTFNSASPIPSSSMKTLFYQQSRQTPQLINIPRNASGAKSSKSTNAMINTALQSSVPPFIVIYGACKKSQQNSDYYKYNKETNPSLTVDSNPLNAPNVEMFDIESVTLQVGTQADCLGQIELNRDQLVQHTLDVIGNPEYRQLLRSEESYIEYGDLGSSQVRFPDLPNTVVSLRDAWTGGLAEGLYDRYRNSGAWNFYIIDMARINLRSTSGVPIIPLVNFGASQYKAISIKPVFRMTEDMWRATQPLTIPQLQCEFNCVLMRPYVRTLPIGNGNLTDDEVFFISNDVSSNFMSVINSDFTNSGEDQISYMGGAFLGSLADKALKVLNHPATKVALTALAGLGSQSPHSVAGSDLEERLRKHKYGSA
jgi:hypothetical protein